MIRAVAGFCKAVDFAYGVTVTAYHMPESIEELGGEAPLWGRRNAFHVRVDARINGERFGWMNIVSTHFPPEAWGMLGEQAHDAIWASVRAGTSS